MSYKNPTIPSIANPVLLDNAIQAIQTKLATLSWLEKAFGRSYEAIEERDGRRFVSPEIYLGSGEYLSMLPNDNFDSYCFFVVEDPESITDYDVGIGAFANLEANIRIIFYGNLERIDSVKTYIFTEELKQDVLDILHRGLTSGPTVEVQNIWTRIENVFDGYTIEPMKTQLFKHPWQGMRFDCKITYRESC